MTDDLPVDESKPELDGYLAPDIASLYVKLDGEWHNFVNEKEALIFTRFKDYGYEGKSFVFVTLDRSRAFGIEQGDDISSWDELWVWKDGKVYEEWHWNVTGELSAHGEWYLRTKHAG